MARTAALIDFLGIGEDNAKKPGAFTSSAEFPRGGNPPPSENGKRSSILDPTSCWSAQPSPTALTPPFMAPNPALRVSRPTEKAGGRLAPLTIFYNGIVAVFDMSPEKAEVLMWLARAATVGYRQPDGTPMEDLLPVARRKSLQRFLEKRKERLSTTTPAYDKSSEVDPKGKKIKKVRWNDKLKLRSDGKKNKDVA